MLDNVMKNANKTVDGATESAVKTAHRMRSAIVDGFHAAASAFTALSGLTPADALGWVGLQRRRGPATAMVSFGAGFLAGAAAGVLFAPWSGAEMRSLIVERFTNVGRERKAEDAPARGEERTAEKAAEVLGKGQNGHQPTEQTH
jgi:hypothetical protein